MDVGQRRVAADLLDDVAGDVDALSRTSRDEQHRVAERLDHAAAAAGDQVGAGRLELLDQVGQLVLVEAVRQLGEADQVGETRPSR